MKKFNITHNIDSLLSLILLAIFGGCILLVLIFGAQMYRTQEETGQETYNRRTSSQYFVTRIHQAETADDVSVMNYGDGDALVIAQNYEDGEYSLILYCYDGMLRELLVSADADLQNDFGPESGDEILEASSLQLSDEQGLVQGTITYEDGTSTSFSALARGAKEAAA